MVIISESVGGALLGTAFGGILDAVVDATNKTTSFKSNLKRMRLILKNLSPIVKEIEELNKGLERPEEETAELIEYLNEGKELVIKCSKVRAWHFHKKPSYTSKLDDLEKKLNVFFQIVMQAQQTRDLKKTSLEVKDLHMDIRSMNTIICGERYKLIEVPWDPPVQTIGLDMPFMKLKMDLFKDGTSVIVLTGPIGCGKTTLAKMLCRDQEVQGKFKDNIFFVTVPETPDLKIIVQSIFYKCHMVVEFLNDEDAINQLERLLRQIEPNPILLILDYVRFASEDLMDKFKFELSDYKILVTSRYEFPRFGSPHRLKTLDIEQAKTLFCYFAVLQGGSSDFPDENLVMEIVKFCRVSPRALEIVAKILCKQPLAKWQSIVMRISETISNFEKLDRLFEIYIVLGSFLEDQRISVTALLDMWHELCDVACKLVSDGLSNNLESRLDALETKFNMYLGSFPEDQRIPASAHIDMSVELYNPDEDSMHAIPKPLKLSCRNPPNLVVKREPPSLSGLEITEQSAFENANLIGALVEEFERVKNILSVARELLLCALLCGRVVALLHEHLH